MKIRKLIISGLASIPILFSCSSNMEPLELNHYFTNDVTNYFTNNNYFTNDNYFTNNNYFTNIVHFTNDNYFTNNNYFTNEIQIITYTNLFDLGNIQVHQNGQIRYGVLNIPYTFGSAHYEATDIYFHENGRVRTGKLASNHTFVNINTSAVNNINYQATNIHFYDNGNVRQGRLNGRHSITTHRGIEINNIADGTWLRLNSDGSFNGFSPNFNPDF